MECYILTQKPFDSSGFRAEGTLIPASVIPHIGVKIYIKSFSYRRTELSQSFSYCGTDYWTE